MFDIARDGAIVLDPFFCWTAAEKYATWYATSLGQVTRRSMSGRTMDSTGRWHTQCDPLLFKEACQRRLEMGTFCVENDNTLSQRAQPRFADGNSRISTTYRCLVYMCPRSKRTLTVKGILNAQRSILPFPIYGFILPEKKGEI